MGKLIDCMGKQINSTAMLPAPQQKWLSAVIKKKLDLFCIILYTFCKVLYTYIHVFKM